MNKYQRMPPTTKGKRLQQRDIASAAGVSISTVSRVLNNIGGISPDLQARVLQAAAQLGYQQKEGQLEHIHILVHATRRDDSFHADVLTGIETACKRYSIPLGYIFTETGPEGRPYMLEQVRKHSADGLLLVSQDDRELLDQIAELNLCIVSMNAEHEGLQMDTFIHDNWGGVRQAIRYLIQHGHRSILHITQLGRTTINKRLAAYRSALEDAGIVYDPQLILNTQLSVQGTYERMKTFLTEDHAPFTAVFCSNDISAIGAARALQEAGRRVPQDVSIIGYGNNPMAAFMVPPLTTVHLEREELGMLAVQRLIDRASTPHLTPVRVELVGRFVERQSVARI